jgi:aerobic C4-dicarboxylate transport protein
MDMTAARPAAEAPQLQSPKWYQQLWLQVLVGIIAGASLGAFWPATGENMKPLGDALIKMIKMMIAPIVFCTVVHGIGSMSDMKRAGRIGLKAIFYFELGTTLALVVGLIMVSALRPGTGLHVDVAALDTRLVQPYINQSHSETAAGFLMDIIPATVVGAFTSGNTLQVLFFGVLFALALQRFGAHGRFVLKLIDDVGKICILLIGLIMRFAPVGAFGAMAFTIGKYGIGAVISLFQFMLCFYATCLIFIFGILGLVAWLVGFSVWKLIRYLKEELLLVFGFSSSEPVLPRLIVKMEKAGCAESVAGLVIPTGYSFNLDGTCIYLTMAAMFLAQATDTQLSLAQELGIIAILLLTSKGATAVTGSGFIVLAATLSSAGYIPVASIALIFGIDRFMSEARALTNFIGTAVATIVVAKWESQLDVQKMRDALGTERPR